MTDSPLAWLRGRDDGRAWLAALPQLVADCAERWRLRLGEPLAGAYVSYPVAATLADRTAAVLKVQFPHRESEHEAAALERWDGDGAIRLLAHDPERHAVLLERCRPGTPLSELGQEAALDVFAALLPRLWKPAGPPFRPLAEEAARWAENVLRAEREPWLAIDPKPLAGEREFGIAPIVRSFELGYGRALVRRRLDRLVGELGLDRERARGWAVAQTVAWCFDSTYREQHLETVRWLLES